MQEPSETYDQYRTALRKLAEGCDFGSITPDKMLQDWLVFGIRDPKVRERLLCEADLTLKKTGEICHAAENTMAQLKVVDDSSSATVSAINKSKVGQQRRLTKVVRECWNSGRQCDFSKRELCPAYGKKLVTNATNPTIFATKCCSKQADTRVRAIEEDEVYQAHIPG